MNAPLTTASMVVDLPPDISPPRVTEKGKPSGNGANGQSLFDSLANPKEAAIITDFDPATKPAACRHTSGSLRSGVRGIAPPTARPIWAALSGCSYGHRERLTAAYKQPPDATDWPCVRNRRQDENTRQHRPF